MIALIAFIVLLLVGVPISFVLGITTIVYMMTEGNMALLLSAPSKLFNGLQNFSLVAIPMFVLLGELMNRGGITERLIQFAKVLLGHFRGGLAYVNVAGNVFLASIIGSATAQSAVMSKTMVPVMEKEGYPRGFSASLTASASIIGPLIPPSMPFIVYGVTAGASISSLFLAGIIPGILFALAFGAYIFFVAKKRGYPKSERASMKQVWQSALYVLPALCIPLVILIGVTSGIFTATESAAVSVFIALIVGSLFYKELKWGHVPGIILRTAITSASVTFLLATSDLFGWMLNFEMIPQAITDVFLTVANNEFTFLLLLNVLLLVIGTVFEGLPALIILTPILLPAAVSFGVDPVHLGVIMNINLTLGLISPPVGSVLFVTAANSGIKVETLARNVMGLLVFSYVILLMITYMDWTSLALPKLFLGN
ncbi:MULTISPECIES: TRAP transporter large permease [Cohnella]|uniref:TRAP transporter large permease n=1 Tax=Cohnella TaxID=329857 RepID=UPI0009BB01AD|nr:MULTISPECIES: TRAP transporter large permease [Cohnella]MBN2981377.1 TRAP transporter large permease [Cohnella algarum]